VDLGEGDVTPEDEEPEPDPVLPNTPTGNNNRNEGAGSAPGTAPTQGEPTVAQPRRSSRTIKPRNILNLFSAEEVNVCLFTMAEEPLSYQQAVHFGNAKEWSAAMEAEMS